MSGTQPERRRSLFPDLTDWFGADFPRFSMWRSSAFGTHPIPIEVTSNDSAYTLRAELPGMDPEKDIEITVDGDVLTVSAEHTESAEDKDHSEFRYGFFRRSVRLPGRIPADEVDAAYEDGILTVRVAMEAEPPVGRRTIPVKRPGNEQQGEGS
ncbi:Hsp20/alpha crystallin family protein [Streptomyces yangpuensis]|uniref:Hsp20/alpha crystallin family protein n=1 Tax=Streptomyces yangpuensis TaxID=1648182 RepID=A0ABY5PPY5_9ACTN|nr:Hsp20/alpha crystallin family protein [Streptomyces yangpuensis]UUY46054.1 Hsp20/alpha crystallin family protein [Streptomyces yangpuensis]